MNKFLPLLFLFFALGKDKASSLGEFLKNIDFASFKPVLQLLGLSDKTLDFICSEQFSELLDGSADLKSLIPVLTSFLNNNNEKKTEEKEKPDKSSGETYQSGSVTRKNLLSPIENVAPTEIETSLGTYFS